MNQKKIVDQLLKEKDLYEKSTKEKRTEIQIIWDAYNGDMTDKRYPWQSNKFIPKMRTEISYIMPFIFSGDPEIEVEGVGEEDTFLAENLEKMVNHRLNNDLKAFEPISSWVLQGITFGTSLLRISWEFQTTKEEEELDNGETQEVERVVEDKPKLTVPNILDIYVNPLIPDVQKQHSIIERSVQSIADIKANPIYQQFKENLKALKPKGQFKKSNAETSESLNDSDLSETEKLQTDMNSVEVFERWTKDRIQTIAIGEEPVLLRDSKNPYGFIPYAKFIFEKDSLPNRFYGKGVGQNSIDLQALFYDIFNQIMDNIKNIANKMVISEKGNIRNPEDVVSKPGGIITVNDIDKIKPLEQSDIKESVFKILSFVGDEHKRSTGANNLLQGAETGDTATGDQIRQMNSSSRFDLVKKRFTNALSEVASHLTAMELTNLQDVNSSILRIFPAEAREEILNLLVNEAENLSYNIRVKGDTALAVNKDVARKQLIDLYNLVADILTEKEKRAYARAIMQMGGSMSVLNVPIDDLIAEEPQFIVDPATGEPVDGSQLPPVDSQVTGEDINQSIYQQ